MVNKTKLAVKRATEDNSNPQIVRSSGENATGVIPGCA